VVLRILSNISGCTGPIFAIFSPYESTIHFDDGSLPYFPICQGTLPWQRNSFATMKQTNTTCILCRSPDGGSVSFRYYLLGGNIVTPSGLLARLCHTFLVFFLLIAKQAQYLLYRFSRSFHQMEGICVNFLDQVHFFGFLKGRCHGNQFRVVSKT